MKLHAIHEQVHELNNMRRELGHVKVSLHAFGADLARIVQGSSQLQAAVDKRVEHITAKYRAEVLRRKQL